MEWDKMYTGGDIRMTSLLPSGKERIDMSGTKGIWPKSSKFILDVMVNQHPPAQ